MTARVVAVVATLAVALMLAMLPLPELVQPLRPDWVTMVVLYWAIALQPRFGLAVPFGAGLLLDVAQGTLLGQNALGTLLAAAFVMHHHQRMRVYPLTQQAVVVALLLAAKQALVLWTSGLAGRAPDDPWPFFGGPALALVFWPVVFVLLRDLRRRYQIA
ncbi:MAG: rod shape-determining protein MreD [Proteobacteria bacterium SW_6_67_9]|nr:MAG: rod shape-determining protein MreD [Proteobacteria bacterium SW_6_67_9]